MLAPSRLAFARAAGSGVATGLLTTDDVDAAALAAVEEVALVDLEAVVAEGAAVALAAAAFRLDRSAATLSAINIKPLTLSLKAKAS